jgi:hypothetical protein
MTEWAEFAHTLELKMYLRMVNAYPADAQAGVTKLYTSPDFLTVNAGMNNYVNTPNKDNPFYEYNIRSLNTTTNVKGSQTLVSFLEATNDPRTSVLFGSGNPQAINQGDYNDNTSAFLAAISPIQSATDPVWFMSAPEAYFLRAEAVARYGVTDPGGSAAVLYQDGINASFVEYGLTTTQASTYSAQPAVAYPNGTLANNLQAIITQKWISFAHGCHSLEGFFDQQRTGFPKISTVYSTDPGYIPGQWVYSKNGVTPNKMFPKRILFPKYEVDNNKNTPTQVPITTSVWWGM